MSYRKALDIIKELLEEDKKDDFLEDDEKSALRVACRALRKSIYSQEVMDNDWK